MNRSFSFLALSICVFLLCEPHASAQDESEDFAALSLEAEDAALDAAGAEAWRGRNRRGSAIQDRQPRGQFRAPEHLQERATHRGYEIRSSHFSVIAEHRQEALAMHQNLAGGWQETSRLLDAITQVHRRPEFAQGAVQVMFDRRLPTGEEEPAAVVAYQGPQTMIYLPADFAEGTSTEQSATLHAAAAQALLHTAQLDTQLPSWVTEGLAGYVGQHAAKQAGESTTSLPSIAVAAWKQERNERRDPVEISLSDSESLDKVRFLLSGEDGQHAMPFLQAVQETLSLAMEQQAEQIEARDLQRAGMVRQVMFDREETTGSLGTAPVDELFEQLAPRFTAWKKDPQFNQPILPATKASPEYLAAREELLVVLKLMRRMETVSQPVNVKIVGLSATGKPMIEQPRRSQRFFSLEKLAAELQREDAPQAVVNAEGELILPHETERMRALLGLQHRHITPSWQEDRICFSTPLNGVETLRGWLEPNAEDEARPLAKFEVVKRR
jgi:hypothetical protein